MVVIEGLKDGPVKGDVCILTLYGEESVIEHFEDKALLVGKWKALEQHGRIVDLDNCMYSNCPHFGKTSCTLTIICGIWKCTMELEGKTFAIATSTTGTGPITGFVGNGTGASK